MFKYKYSKLYWFFKDLSWMKVYFSPFKPIIPRFYLGKTAISTPIFLPRKWVKATPKRALEATLKHIKETKEFNERNPDYKKTVKSFGEIYDAKMKHTYAVPLKVGFSFCGLGFKTKWSSTDFRHEWNPIWSIVFFGYQIALIFRPENDCHYWESYLYYTYATDKSKSAKERIEQARKDFPNIWNTYSNGETTKINYWDVVLKDMYEKQVTK